MQRVQDTQELPTLTRHFPVPGPAGALWCVQIGYPAYLSHGVCLLRRLPCSSRPVQIIRQKNTQSQGLGIVLY